MQVDLRILRYDPERDEKPHWEAYIVESDPKADRVLDLLHRVKYEQDGSLTFRRSLRPRRVRLGRDADQRPQPARLQDAGRAAGQAPDHVAPLPGLPVIKDLVVDMDGFFAKFRSVQPFLIDETPRPGARADPESPEDRAALRRHDQVHPVRRVHLVVPVVLGPAGYVGPAAIVNAHRFIFDSRDEGGDERLEILADKDGVWRCRTIFNCTDACPRGIHITQAILEVSSAIVERQT